MVLFVRINPWMLMFELVVSSMCMLILGGWYGTGDGWKFILTGKWANQMSQKIKSSSFHSTTSPLTWRPLHPRRDKDLSCLLNSLMFGIQKCGSYKNYFRFKTDLD